MPAPRVSGDNLQKAILTALSVAEPVWQEPAALARRMGVDLDALNDALTTLDLAGCLAIWERPDDVVVAISATAARERSLRLRTTAEGGNWYWEGAAESGRSAAPRGKAASAVDGRRNNSASTSGTFGAHRSSPAGVDAGIASERRRSLKHPPLGAGIK